MEAMERKTGHIEKWIMVEMGVLGERDGRELGCMHYRVGLDCRLGGCYDGAPSA